MSTSFGSTLLLLLIGTASVAGASLASTTGLRAGSRRAGNNHSLEEAFRWPYMPSHARKLDAPDDDKVPGEDDQPPEEDDQPPEEDDQPPEEDDQAPEGDDVNCAGGVCLPPHWELSSGGLVSALLASLGLRRPAELAPVIAMMAAEEMLEVLEAGGDVPEPPMAGEFDDLPEPDPLDFEEVPGAALKDITNTSSPTAVESPPGSDTDPARPPPQNKNIRGNNKSPPGSDTDPAKPPPSGPPPQNKKIRGNAKKQRKERAKQRKEAEKATKAANHAKAAEGKVKHHRSKVHYYN